MRLRALEHQTWNCEPLVAAFVVFRAATTARDELLIDDLERANPVAKRLQVMLDDEVVLEVHCMFDGDGNTSVEFLIPDAAGVEAEGVARDVALAAIALAGRERLMRRRVGFGQ